MRSTFLISIPGFAKNETDTTCIPFSQLFIRTINKNYPEIEVIIVTLDHPESKEYTWFGNKVIPMNGSKLRFRPLLWLKLYRLLKRLSSEEKLVGILNFWCADNALVSHYFTKWNKVRSYTWLQGQDARKGNKALIFFKPRNTDLIALSDFLRDEFNRNYSIVPAHTIYPGVDHGSFTPAEIRDIDIIGVGSLTSLKRYHLLIQLIGKLKKNSPHIKAMIVGKGPEELRLRKMITEKNLDRNIELCGEKDHAFALQLMARAKILLHPSSYEGYTIACLEGLAAGCEVVSFVSPESKRVPNWHIVKDEDEMKEKCLEILQSPINLRSIVPHLIGACVENILSLYGYSKPAPVFNSKTELVAE